MARLTYIPSLQTAHSLCNFYVRLKELGHPVYLDQNFEDKLECSVAMSVAAEKVYSIRTCMIEPEYTNLADCWLKLVAPQITY